MSEWETAASSDSLNELDGDEGMDKVVRFEHHLICRLHVAQRHHLVVAAFILEPRVHDGNGDRGRQRHIE